MSDRTGELGMGYVRMVKGRWMHGDGYAMVCMYLI